MQNNTCASKVSSETMTGNIISMKAIVPQGFLLCGILYHNGSRS